MKDTEYHRQRLIRLGKISKVLKLYLIKYYGEYFCEKDFE
jgi:hypothetical protein